jgi:hypothetical protein
MTTHIRRDAPQRIPGSMDRQQSGIVQNIFPIMAKTGRKNVKRDDYYRTPRGNGYGGTEEGPA